VPFQYLLTNLLVDVPGALGAVFMDPDGESIELVSRRPIPYALKIEGAYHGIFLRRAARLAEIAGSGQVEQVAVSGRDMKVVSQQLRGGYYVVLALDPEAPTAVAARVLQRSRAAFDREIP
jgi:predicted regulator of Ras-like GTPase activity (Roadblock/LC7/MglB family)